MRYFLAALTALSLATSVVVTVPATSAAVQPLDEIYQRLRPTGAVFGQEDLLENANTQRVLVKRVARVIRVALTLLGVIFLLLTVYAGARWMTARGNDELVTEARHTLFNALIGLLIIAVAYAFTAFLVGRVLQATT